MSHCNIVRFKIRPGMDREFLLAHGPGKINWPGLRQGTIVQTGEGAYCLFCEWPDAQTMKHAMPNMLATLDTFRHTLVPGESGVTEASSGPAVLTIG